jgi:predicted lipoprotein with Yx(FWY)xxD motif
MLLLADPSVDAIQSREAPIRYTAGVTPGRFCRQKRMRMTLLLLIAAALALGAGSVRSAEAQSGATLTVRDSRYGRVLFDGRGYALYAFTRDRRGGLSRCYGACARAWPVYFAPRRLRAASGVNPSLLGTTRRRDGRRQVTYNGRPLYRYVGDRRPGLILCQNVDEFGGKWLIVRPSGKLAR